MTHVDDETRPVTVDTGGPDDVFPGALVTWLHVPRGGCGFVTRTPARVISCPRRPSTRVRIEVITRNGCMVTRVVEAKSLRWRLP